MIEWIIKYWAEVAFGLVVTGAGICIKKIWSMYKKEKAGREDKIHAALVADFKKMLNETTTTITTTVNENDHNLQNQIDQITQDQNLLKNGMLCLQGDYFKKKCSRYLEEDHKITEEEYLHLCSEHDVYKMLGGNSNGDRLFKLCEDKVKKTLCEPHEDKEGQ